MVVLFLLNNHGNLSSLHHPGFWYLVNRRLYQTIHTTHWRSLARHRDDYCRSSLAALSLIIHKTPHQKNISHEVPHSHDTPRRLLRIMVFRSSSQHYRISWFCLCPDWIAANFYDFELGNASLRASKRLFLCFCCYDYFCQYTFDYRGYRFYPQYQLSSLLYLCDPHSDLLVNIDDIRQNSSHKKLSSLRSRTTSPLHRSARLGDSLHIT